MHDTCMTCNKKMKTTTRGILTPFQCKECEEKKRQQLIKHYNYEP